MSAREEAIEAVRIAFAARTKSATRLALSRTPKALAAARARYAAADAADAGPCGP